LLVNHIVVNVVKLVKDSIQSGIFLYLYQSILYNNLDILFQDK
jgi:hypothetical protein